MFIIFLYIFFVLVLINVLIIKSFSDFWKKKESDIFIIVLIGILIKYEIVVFGRKFFIIFFIL